MKTKIWATITHFTHIRTPPRSAPPSMVRAPASARLGGVPTRVRPSACPDNVAAQASPLRLPSAISSVPRQCDSHGLTVEPRQWCDQSCVPEPVPAWPDNGEPDRTLASTTVIGRLRCSDNGAGQPLDPASKSASDY